MKDTCKDNQMNTSQISLSDFQCEFRHIYSGQKCFLFMTEKQRATTEGLMTAKISFTIFIVTQCLSYCPT